MFKAILIPLYLLAVTPSVTHLPTPPLETTSFYHFQVSSDSISPGSKDDVLVDITITYILRKPCSILIRVMQNEKPITTIDEKPNQAPDSYAIVWDGRDSLGNYVKDGSYELEFCINGDEVESFPIEVSSLIAKINVPKEGVLTRGQVPIFGIACGRNFKKYVVEYAKQDIEDKWVTTKESTIPKADWTQMEDLAIGDETIYGNLATWDTGLTNYYYYDTEVDLSGPYIIRLTVFDEAGNRAFDEVKVDVGKVISFIYGGKVESLDNKVSLRFPEHAIKTPFILFNIQQAGSDCLDNLGGKEGYRLISQIYEIEPEGVSFARPVLLTMHYDSGKIQDKTRLGIYAYEPDLRIWRYLPTEHNKKDKALVAKITSTQNLYAYYAIFERVKEISAPILYDLPLDTQFNIIDVHGEAEMDQRVKIYVNDEKKREVQCDAKTGIFKFSKVLLKNGKNRITARAMDEFGNFSPYSNTVTSSLVLKNPKKVYSIRLKDSEFKEDLRSEEVNIGDSLFIELLGEDADKNSIDATPVLIKNTSIDTSGIEILLLETGFNTGLYRAVVTLSDKIDPAERTLAVQDAGEEIIIRSLADSSKRVIITTKRDEPSILPETLILPTSLVLCQNTFEEGFDEWRTLDGEEGAFLSRDNEVTPDRSFSLKLTNKKYGGSFGAVVRDAPFNVAEYPIISFDYAIPENVKINFLVKTGGRWYDIRFTDDDKIYQRINMVKIGKVENVICDNKWHFAEFNLYEMLRKYTGKRLIERIIMADYDVTGFMKLGYGRNPRGAAFYIDNFVTSKRPLNKSSLRISSVPWEIGINDGSSKEFSNKPISLYQIGDDVSNFPRFMSKKNKKLEIIFNMSEKDLSKDCILGLNFLKSLKEENLKVQVNGSPISYFHMDSARTSLKVLIEQGLLKNGNNTVTIQYHKAKKTLEWDNLSFMEMSTTNWEIGIYDNSNDEFLYEAEVGDDYYVGDAIEDFERAITKSDARTNMHFYLSQEDSQGEYNFFLKAKDWDVRNYDYINFDILLNENKITSVQCPYKDGTTFNIKLDKGLKEGWNVLSLKWKGGGDWVSWDYLRFEPLAISIRKASSSWAIGYNDNSFSEFSHEIDIGDDYFIGSDFKNFERAISIQDPITNIKFYLEKDMLNRDYEFFIKPFDIQPIDIQPKISGVFFEVRVNIQEKGTYNMTPAKEPLRILISKDSLREGENTISLQWLAGCDWVAWDYLKFGPVKK